MNIEDMTSAIKTLLYNLAQETLDDILKENAALKQLKNQIVFCSDCRFSRVDMSTPCGYFCGHPAHIINMECYYNDFCSFGERKNKND